MQSLGVTEASISFLWMREKTYVRKDAEKFFREMQDEVLGLKFQDQQASPNGISARNPAFDVTPHELFTGWITELRVIYPPFNKNLLEAVKSKGKVQE